MKKTITLLLALAFTASVFVTGACAVSLGSGIEVVASEVDMVKTAICGEKLVFSDGDFKSALAVSDFTSITVTKLPSSTEGTLLAAGKRVKEGQTVKRRNIGSLCFVPASAEVREAGFRFRLNGAGAELEASCRIKFLKEGNGAPTVPEESEASLSVRTQSGISLHGRLSATDPEGDALEFIVVAFPKQGAVRVTDKSTGSYEYTPTGDFVGYDAFTYVVRDEYGNYSEPVSVRIQVTERLSDVVFTDMLGRSEYGAAVAMSAMGVMSAETYGAASYFKPDERVTRAEFVAMALKAYGINPSGMGASFFDDDCDVPSALSEYVSYAGKAGIIDGDFGEGGLVFRPSDSVTLQDAAVIISRLLGVGGGEESVFVEETSVASWAVPSVYAMFTLGIFDADAEIDGSHTLTRGEVAEYLYRMVNVK